MSRAHQYPSHRLMGWTSPAWSGCRCSCVDVGSTTCQDAPSVLQLCAQLHTRMLSSCLRAESRLVMVLAGADAVTPQHRQREKEHRADVQWPHLPGKPHMRLVVKPVGTRHNDNTSWQGGCVSCVQLAVVNLVRYPLGTSHAMGTDWQVNHCATALPSIWQALSGQPEGCDDWRACSKWYSLYKV